MPEFYMPQLLKKELWLYITQTNILTTPRLSGGDELQTWRGRSENNAFYD